MKTSTGLTYLLSALAATGCGIWTIVEFIIYLVKDKPFNWWSIGLMAAFFIISIVSLLVTVFYEPKKKKTTTGVPKSKFMERLEKAQKEKGKTDYKTNYHDTTN